MTRARDRLRLAAGVGALIVMTCAAGAPTASSAAEPTRRFDVPDGEISDSLKAYALQADIQIIYSEVIGTHLRIAPLIGSFTPEEALGRMLRGTPFVYARLPNGVLRVYRPPTPLAAGRTTPRQSYEAPPRRSSAPSSTRRDGQVEAVVVTGSRVIQSDAQMSTPVTSISVDQLGRTAASTIQDGLQTLPAFDGGRGPQSNPGNSSQNTAAHVLNLRNLGITRTLILLDGRRMTPTTPLAEVGVDFVPVMLLRQVDVVTGGASAVYGSDAIAGVVNFVTDQNFNGYKIEGHYGLSTYGDGEETAFGFAGGAPVFAGRGHIEASYSYYNAPGVFSKLGREWGRRVYTNQGAGTEANPLRLVSDTRLSTTSFYGLIRSGPLAGLQFRENGVLSAFVHGAPTPSAGVESGGDGGYYYQTSLQALQQSDQLFGRFDFDLKDNLRFHLKATGSLLHNRNNHQTNEFRNVTLSADNAYLLPEYAAALSAANAKTFLFSKMMTQAPPLSSETYAQGEMVEAGLEGESRGYEWEASYVHSRNQQRTRNNANIDNQKAAAALDAVRAPDGQIVCRVSLTNPGLYPGCTPLNLFGPTSESPEALDYILTRTAFVSTTQMDDVGANLRGSPFSTWAGSVQMALSAEWRRLTYDQTSDAQPALADCAGLTSNCGPTTLKYISNVLADAHGLSQTVAEGAVEADIPLLANAPWAKALNINGGARYADYDTSGGATTWKVGVDWRINDQITLRGTRSHDIRAPNLNELFAPDQINPAGVIDRHTNVIGQAPLIIRSNPNLKPEVAQTWTAGLVLKPRAVQGLSLTIDWYRTDIRNAITLVQGNSLTVQNLCEASGGASDLCGLAVRPLPFSDHSPANFATAFYQETRNGQSVETDGVDLEADYTMSALAGVLNLRGLASYQPHNRVVQFAGATPLENAGSVNEPEWRLAGFARYSWRDVSVDVQQRWISSTWWSADRTLVFADPPIPSLAYTNVSLTYAAKGAEYYFSIRNLLNAAPRNAGGQSSVPGLFSGYGNGDDLLGRYFMIGFRLRR